MKRLHFKKQTQTPNAKTKTKEMTKEKKTNAMTNKKIPK